MKADRQKVKLKERMLDVLFRIIHYGCLTLGFTFVIVFVVGPILWQKAFGPEKELVIIDQEVGGKLICNSIYNADIHSWYYDLDYDYDADLVAATVPRTGASSKPAIGIKSRSKKPVPLPITAILLDLQYWIDSLTLFLFSRW